jgi:hypothetical protein
MRAECVRPALAGFRGGILRLLFDHTYHRSREA